MIHERGCRCGVCHCGCGERTLISPNTNASRGLIRGMPRRFLAGHHLRARRGTRNVTTSGYVGTYAPEHPRAVSRPYVPEHVLVAERVLGHQLPAGAIVHHVNSDRRDNRPENLVICQDAAYHRLIHVRQDALRACGHAGWLRCRRCGQYDDPSKLYVKRGARRVTAHHRSCDAAYRLELKARRNA